MRVKYDLCVSFTDPTVGFITIKLPFGESKDVIADAILGEISVPNLEPGFQCSLVQLIGRSGSDKKTW